MLQKKNLLLLALLSFSVLITPSCEKEGKNEKKISMHGGDESHNMGQNCMECHKSGGDGEGWFNVAGTVYDSTLLSTLANTTIKLYTEADGGGQLKYTIEGDKKGNYYTTEDVNFGDGLFPSVQGPTGTKYMSTSVKTGECYSCHGVTTDKLWAK